MKTGIDCLLIGHNQITFEAYEKSVREMGHHSGAYNDLKKNFIRYNGKNHNAADIFNLFCCYDNLSADSISPIKLVETFSNGIAYLGTYLHRSGLSFDYVNSFREQKEELAEKLAQENILTIGILTTLYVNALPILEIMNFIKTHNKTAKIVIGGPFVATKYRTHDNMEFDFLLKSIDADFYINSSQGEAALVEIIHRLKMNLSCDQVHNLYYKTGRSGEYQATGLLREDNKLSENMVNWDLFRDIGPFVNLRTSISCPFSCAFCGFPQHAGQYQTAAVEDVEKELNLLAKKENIKSIHFVDDTFNVPAKRFKEILRMMIKNKYPFKWNSFFRCQFADPEMVELMKESGCESVLLGIESGNDQVLGHMNKNATVDKYLKGITLLKKYGIVTLGNFVVGFPGETEETLEDTTQFIKESGLDFYRSQLWYCEPITPIWEKRETYELKGENFEWSHRTMDSQTASKLVDKMILTIDSPTRFPQYYFDYDNVIQLVHKGITMEKVDRYLHSFNLGIKEKLAHPYQKEASYEVIKKIKDSCREILGVEQKENLNDTDEGRVEFDF